MAVMDVIKAKMPTDWSVVLAKLPPVVNILMVLLVAQSLAVLTWKLVPSPSLPAAPADLGVAPSNSVPSAQAVTRYNIASWHLFGDASVVPLAPEAPEMIPEDAPDTRLSLTLLGVIAGSDLNAWAIISDRSGNEETYGIDSPVPGGAVLKEIFADRVILLHNGRFETLRLPQEMVDTASLEPRQAPASRSSASRFGSATTNASGGAITRLGDQATQVVKEYKQALMSDPQSVMDAVRAEPYRQGGQLKGYRVFPGRDKQLMGRVGLLPGDVVTAVNGIDLDSPLKGLEIMQQVQDATEVSVDVLRNGVTQTFLVPLN